MKKYLIIIILSLGSLVAQISQSEIKKISESLNNSELRNIQSQLKNNSSNSVSNENKEIEKIIPSSVTIKSANTSGNNEYFGYNYFNRNLNFFDNIPTPPDYKLGPGDEIIISLWGETNLRQNFLINKDGAIFYENIGFINISNLSINEAEKFLTKQLTSIYSTLSDSNNSSNLKVELGDLKSMNVYFTGQIINPGINLVHPFSDIFAAIIQAGGVQKNGSLRKIELIRNGETISIFDFYDFFIDGKNVFSDTRILDGDIIHIPIISKRVNISGPVYKNGFFEMVEDESLSDLLTYAGGLRPSASKFAIIEEIISQSKRQNDDSAKLSQKIQIDDFSSKAPNDGDIIKILSINDQETDVIVRGRVKSPGSYPSNSTLKSVLDLAGGFNDNVYRKSIIDDEIIILRKDENQLYSLEFKVSYNESGDFNLFPGDQIFVFENTNYDNSFLVSINGEIKKSGTYQFKSGTTIADIIKFAGGLTELANPNGIIVEETFSSINNDGDLIEERIKVNNADSGFKISKNSRIEILPLENVVNVSGNVYNEGLIAFEKGNLKKYISLAGGYKKDTLKRKVYVQRANGEVNTVSLFRGRFIQIKRGDSIIVPTNPNPRDFDITAFISDVATTLANIAAILIVVDNQNN